MFLSQGPRAGERGSELASEAGERGSELASELARLASKVARRRSCLDMVGMCRDVIF